MNEYKDLFRRVLFGGFHRQDVQEYLENLTESRAEEKEIWDARLEEQKEGCRQAEERLQQAEAKLKEAEDRVREQEEKAERLRGILEEKSEDLVQAEARISVLETQIRTLEPQAKSWQKIRDTAGEIEVSAHERAQTTIQAARSHAAEIHSEGLRWLMEIQNRCDTLQRDIQTSMIAAERELDVIRESFSRADEDMDGFQGALTSLLETAECDKKKP